MILHQPIPLKELASASSLAMQADHRVLQGFNRRLILRLLHDWTFVAVKFTAARTAFAKSSAFP